MWLTYSLAISAIVFFAAMAVNHIRFMKSSNYQSGYTYYVQAIWQMLLGTVGLIAIVFQINKMANISAEQYKWNKKVKAMEINNNFDSIFEELLQIRLFRIQHGKNDMLLEKVPKEIDVTKKTHLLKVLNFYESIAVGIEHDLYDNDLVYDYLCNTIIRFYDYADDFINEQRILYNDPLLGIGLEELAKKWKIRYNKEIEIIERGKISSGASSATDE
jgi:hypothetical protein